MNIKISNNKEGATLLEIIVSLAIFSVIILMSVGIFQAVLTSQQSTVAAQTKQESLKYVFEVISKDMRSAVRGDDDCELIGGNAVSKIFNKDIISNPDGILYFKDKDGLCTYYEVLDGTFMVTKGGIMSSTTPHDLLVTAFNFSIVDNAILLPVNTVQPMLTFSIEMEDRAGKDIERQPVTVQTTISSRFYE